MMKQKNFGKLNLFLATAFLAGACAFTNFTEAAAEPAVVYDEAELLEDDEVLDIESAVTDLKEASGWEIFVLTTDDAEGCTTQEFSEEFLDTHLSGDDGLVYTIDMDNREVYLATTGETIYYLTDERIEDIIDSGYNDVADGYYADAFLAMIEATDDWYNAGIPSNQYTYDTDTGEIVRYHEPKAIKWYEALIALAIAAGAFAIVFVSVIGKYRLKWGTYKYDFHANGKVHLTEQDDRFVNEFVTHRHIPRNTSSGGGGGSRSSVHRGSGGRSYGGGGRKF